MFKLRFAFRLWCRSGLSIREALAYPVNRLEFPDMSPEELADEEISTFFEWG